MSDTEKIVDLGDEQSGIMLDMGELMIVREMQILPAHIGLVCTTPGEDGEGHSTVFPDGMVILSIEGYIPGSEGPKTITLAMAPEHAMDRGGRLLAIGAVACTLPKPPEDLADKAREAALRQGE